MKKNNLIISSVAVLFFLCGLFLSYIGTKSLDYGNAKTWWTIYFMDPNSKDLSFTIENHSNSNNFHWEIISGNSIISKGDETIGNNQIKNIPLPSSPPNGKTSIVVTHGSDKRDIYKNNQ